VGLLSLGPALGWWVALLPRNRGCEGTELRSQIVAFVVVRISETGVHVFGSEEWTSHNSVGTVERPFGPSSLTPGGFDMLATRIALALAIALGAATLTRADDKEDAKGLLVGVWRLDVPSVPNGQREEVVEFTADGKFSFTPPDKSFAVRKGTYKVVSKDKVEVEITEGLLKGEKRKKETVKFVVTKDKLTFDARLNRSPVPSQYVRKEP
jgi:uncharacterized protein (TIGR03066 family)